MSPFVDFGVDRDWLRSPWVLRDDKASSPFVQLIDYPIAIECFIGNQSSKREVRYQGRNTDGIIALAG